MNRLLRCLTSAFLFLSWGMVSHKQSPIPSAFCMKHAACRLVLAVVTCVLIGCDPTVDPFQENDQHYSIFGYLNVTADTQFIRVEKLRDGQATQAPPTLNVTVQLTNVATDETVTLQDSLVHFFGDATAHNFYTTADIAPNTTYRLVVEGPNGAVSRAETTTPRRPRTTVVRPVQDCFPSCDTPWLGPACESPDEGSDRKAVLRVENTERLVAVKAVYDMVAPEGRWSFDSLSEASEVDEGVFQARAGYDNDWCRMPPPSTQDREAKTISMIVAAGGPDWPDFMGLDPEMDLLPTVASNVEGGVGLLGGIATDTLIVDPYEE